MSKAYADSAYLQRRVPETAAVAALDPDHLTDALSDAEPMISLDAYGSRSELAHAFYTAHLLAVRFASTMGGSESGPVQSRKIDGLAHSYVTPTIMRSESDPASTRWGRLYMEQRALASAGQAVVG